jgi:glycerol-3-phosphate cytidylyltransferase
MKQYKVGITFGAFDPLHYGHIKLFERAKEQCEKLVVCVSSAGYIQKNKGHAERVSLPARLDAVTAVRFVDVVDIQREHGWGKAEAIEYYKADAIFVGDDWKPETFTGEGLGVPVVYLPHTKGISSTALTIESEITDGIWAVIGSSLLAIGVLLFFVWLGLLLLGSFS